MIRKTLRIHHTNGDVTMMSGILSIKIYEINEITPSLYYTRETSPLGFEAIRQVASVEVTSEEER